MAFFLKYNDVDYSQGKSQTKEAFKALTKGNILQPYKLEDDSRSSNDDDYIGYNIYAFDKRHQKISESAQPIKVEPNFDGVILAGIYGFSLVLTNMSVSISSDGQRMLDLT